MLPMPDEGKMGLNRIEKSENKHGLEKPKAHSQSKAIPIVKYVYN